MSPSRPRALARTAAVLLAAVSITFALSGCTPVADLVIRSVNRGVEQAREQSTPRDSDSDSDSDSNSGTSTDDEVASDEGNTAFEDIGVGDCLNDADLAAEGAVDEIFSLDVVPCSEPHDSEVYGTFTYPDGDYPTDEQLDSLASDGCFDLFEDFVGTDYDTSQLDYSFYTPTRAGWKYGDRDALCELYDMDLAKLTGSAEATGL